MTLALLSSIIQLLTALTNLISKVIEGQPQEVREQLWRRHLEETEWAHKLMAKLSDRVEKIIEDSIANEAGPSRPDAR